MIQLISWSHKDAGKIAEKVEIMSFSLAHRDMSDNRRTNR